MLSSIVGGEYPKIFELGGHVFNPFNQVYLKLEMIRLRSEAISAIGVKCSTYMTAQCIVMVKQRMENPAIVAESATLAFS